MGQYMWPVARSRTENTEKRKKNPVKKAIKWSEINMLKNY